MGDNSTMVIQRKPSMNKNSEQLLPSQKRMRADVPSQPLKIEGDNPLELESKHEHTAPQVGLNQDQHIMPVKVSAEMKMEASASSEDKSPYTGESRSEDMDNVSNQRLDVESVGETPKQNSNQLDKEADQVKQENIDQSDEPPAVTKSGKPKIKRSVVDRAFHARASERAHHRSEAVGWSGIMFLFKCH